MYLYHGYNERISKHAAHVEQNKTLCDFSGAKRILTNLLISTSDRPLHCAHMLNIFDCDWIQCSTLVKKHAVNRNL